MARPPAWQSQPSTVITFSGLDCLNKLGMSPTRARQVIKGLIPIFFRTGIDVNLLGTVRMVIGVTGETNRSSFTDLI